MSAKSSGLRVQSEAPWAIAPAAASPGDANLPQLAIDVRGGACRLPFDDRVKGRQHAEPLVLAQAADPIRIVADRLAHDLALRLVQTLGRLPQPGDRLVVERERHLDHTDTILP